MPNDDQPISNLEMVTIYLELAHDARIRADHAGASSAAQIAQTYALLALGEALRPAAPAEQSGGEYTPDEVDAA